jgi:hypothetical protein
MPACVKGNAASEQMFEHPKKVNPDAAANRRSGSPLLPTHIGGRIHVSDSLEQDDEPGGLDAAMAKRPQAPSPCAEAAASAAPQRTAGFSGWRPRLAASGRP